MGRESKCEIKSISKYLLDEFKAQEITKEEFLKLSENVSIIDLNNNSIIYKISDSNFIQSLLSENEKSEIQITIEHFTKNSKDIKYSSYEYQISTGKLIIIVLESIDGETLHSFAMDGIGEFIFNSLSKFIGSDVQKKENPLDEVIEELKQFNFIQSLLSENEKSEIQITIEHFTKNSKDIKYSSYEYQISTGKLIIIVLESIDGETLHSFAMDGIGEFIFNSLSKFIGSDVQKKENPLDEVIEELKQFKPYKGGLIMGRESKCEIKSISKYLLDEFKAQDITKEEFNKLSDKVTILNLNNNELLYFNNIVNNSYILLNKHLVN